MNALLFLSTVMVAIAAGQCQMCDLNVGPAGFQLKPEECGCHHHRHQQIEVQPAAENGFQVNPYNDSVFRDCPRCHGGRKSAAAAEEAL